MARHSRRLRSSRDDLTGGGERLNQTQLLFGHDAGEHVGARKPRLQLGLVEARQFHARQCLVAGDDALTGTDLAGLDEARLQARLACTNVFARIMPEQKLRLVQAFAASGQVVAR